MPFRSALFDFAALPPRCAERLCLSDLGVDILFASARLSLADARKQKGPQPESRRLSAHQAAKPLKHLTLQAQPTFVSEHWGDIASVVGVVISLVGFYVTIRGVLRSKKAALSAEKAAHDVKTKIGEADTMVDLSAAITTMEEIKRLHRVNNAWQMLPDRYSVLKRLLISIRTSSPHISEEQKETLLAAVQHFSDMERKVERYLANPEQVPPNAAKLNEIVSMQLDRVNDTLSAIRQQIGTEHYE